MERPELLPLVEQRESMPAIAGVDTANAVELTLSVPTEAVQLLLVGTETAA
jgi:hypothetical protein